MKYLLVILACLFLQGCFYQSVNKSDITAAENKCKAENSEIYEITADFLGSEKVTCLNRKSYVL